MEAGSAFELGVVTTARETVGVRGSLAELFLWDAPRVIAAYLQSSNVHHAILSVRVNRKARNNGETTI